ncbi:MAG: energy transducer TonB [Bacteroidota bacterium]|nr:energy transducer TonB [Bacteroidota bacterium]
MEPNKILSASILDLLFDERNKEYGAYELRKTYPKRITRALIITGTVALLAFTGIALASTLKPKSEGRLFNDEVVLTEIPPDQKPPEALPPPKKIVQPQIRTIQFTTPVITREIVPDPPPTNEDIVNAKIDDVTKDGIPDPGIPDTKETDKTGIIEKKAPEPEIFTAVEVNAKFEGNWEKFLTRNLNPDVPVENGAPSGQYKVLIQFVVDLDGNVSDIKALTNFGFGMEQEAIRVLKKATKWVPANQNGHAVKAYRIQPVTFQVLDQ